MIAPRKGYARLDESQLANVPGTLKDNQRFVCWREASREGKATKIPVDAHTGADAKSDKSETWATLGEASAFYKAHPDKVHGIGRMFHPDDGIIGVDFDDCLDDQGNVIASHVAATWLHRLDSYTETSPSGRGVKVWVRAAHEMGGKSGRKNSKLRVEMYRSQRYFTITGRRMVQFSANVEARQEIVDEFFEAIFGVKKATETNLTSTHRSATNLTDAEIIELANNARNGSKFRALWHGSIDGYASPSEADAALCALLRHQTEDREQVRRIVGQSILGQREKWRERRDYQDATLDFVFEPADLTDIKGGILGVMFNSNLTPAQKATDIGKLVVSALIERGRFYFHFGRRDFGTAMFFNSETKRLLPVQSDEFLSWLSNWCAINRAHQAFRYVRAAVETAALSGPHTCGIVPETFWAVRSTAIYLSSGDGQAAKITPGHVEIVDNGSDGVLFAAGATLASWELTEPRDPFATCKLFSDVNTVDPHGRLLEKLWTLSIPTNPPCKPPLVFAGPIRSGKTREARGICELYGLTFRSIAPKNGDKALADFWTSADAGGILTGDNVDSRIDWLPDALAAASTGVGDVRRKLYSDAAQVELRPKAWIILTAANPLFASDVGLADRLLVVRLGQRSGETADEILASEIAANRNAGLSWLAYTIAAALADTKPTPAELNHRHPDFAKFCVKLGRALGCETEAVAALRAAENDKARFCLENDPVGAALLAMLASGRSFSGTAAELLDKLTEFDSEFSASATGPRGNRLWTPKRLGKRLSAIWLHIDAEADASKSVDRNGFTIFEIKPRLIAEFAEFEMLKHTKLSHNGDIGTLSDSAKESPQTQHNFANWISEWL